MDYTMEERTQKIIQKCMESKSKNPVEIFEEVIKEDYVRMHGPEHHILNSACILTAYHNAGGEINLQEAIAKVSIQTEKMPPAMCSLWGVCGASTSIGAVFGMLEGTSPLSKDDSWGSHMNYTSSALQELSKIGGPRCCKRDGIVCIQTAIPYIKQRYRIKLENKEYRCQFSEKNKQCLKYDCPFYCGD